MKAIALLAPLLLSALLLVPFAAAAFTITVSTDKTSYVGSATIHVSGTVSGGTIPAGTSVSIQIKNPQNTLVDAGTAPVDPATGAYSKDFVAGGPAWSVAGLYTVTVSWAPDISTPPITASTGFSYTPAPPLLPISVQVSAAGPLYPGQNLYIAALVQFNNGSLVDANFTVVHVYFPNGTLINLATLVTPVKIHTGFFAWSYPLDSKAPDGVYMVHVQAVVSSGASRVIANGLSSFVVNSQIASSSALSQLSGKIDSAVSSITSAVNSAVSSISSKVDGAVSSLTSTINGAVSSISSKVDSAVSQITSSVGSLSTYIIALIVIAVIVLVLQIVTLARRRT